MSLKPLGDRVLVKPDAAEQKTASGLYIASNAQEKPQRGEVIAVGAGKLNDKGERIAMDVMMVDITDHPTARVGSSVELWGRNIPVEDVAARAGTIAAELLCGIAPRVPFVEDED